MKTVVNRLFKRSLRVWLVVLAGLALTALGLPPAAEALPPGGAGANTPGTWSRVSPRMIKAGGLLHFTLGGFPKGETVYVKIDDGALCSNTSHGACVYHTQKVPNSGVVNGSFRLPAKLAKGTHTLRFLASAYVDPANPGAGTKGFTNKSPGFTVSGASAGSSATTKTTTTTVDGGSSSSSNGGATSTGTGSVADPKAGAKAKQPAAQPAVPAVSGAALNPAKAGKVKATLSDGLAVLNVGDAYAGEWMFVYAFSDPTPLGWQQVAVDGTVTVPTTELPAGEHRLAVQDVDGALLGWTQVALAAPAAGASAAPAGAPATASAVAPAAPSAASSGGGIGVGLLAGAVAVVLAGFVVVLVRRRRGALSP